MPASKACGRISTPRTGEDDAEDVESAACHFGDPSLSPEVVTTVGPIACLALLVATMFNCKRLRYS